MHAFFLQDVALLNQLPEYPAKRLFGDFENVQELRNLHAGIAVHEMQNAMVGASKGKLCQDIVGIAGKVAVGKEQQLDDVPDQFAACRLVAAWRAGKQRSI